MKYLVILCNGLTDEPIVEKDNRTPLQLADIPNLHRLTQNGRCGSVQTIPEGFHVGGDVSYLSLLGYAPEEHHQGTASVEAKALGIELQDGEIPLCCDFVMLQSSHNDMIVKDFTAGRLSNEDARILLDALQDQVVDAEISMHAGQGYHNLMVWKHPPFPERLVPPHELVGEGIRQHIMQGEEYKQLVFIMNQIQIILHNHPLNRKRMQTELDSINSIWLWGNDSTENRDAPPSFFSRFEKRAACVSASLLLKGLAQILDIDFVPVAGATGHLDTDYHAKVEATLQALDNHDVVFLHVAGAEAVSLHGHIDDKVQAIEEFDEKVLGPILQAVDQRDDLKLLLTECHMSSVNLMRYKNTPVPFVAYPSSKGKDDVEAFSEDIVQSGSEHFKSGPQLIETFFKGAL